MTNKPFSRSLYDQYNTLGIETAVHFLAQQGYTLTDTKEAFKSHDIIVTKDGKPYKVECEVTAKWQSLHFPYRTMSVPHRKKDSKADFYVRTNASGSALFFCPMAHVHGSKVITKNTCYTTNEKFFDCDLPPLYICEGGEWYLQNNI